MGTSSSATSRQCVGTLNALSRARASLVELVDAERAVGRHDHRGRDRGGRRRARRRRRTRAGHRRCRATRARPRSGTRSRRCTLNMSSRRPVEEQVAVGVEPTQVAGRVEAVGGEDVGAGAAADPAHQVRDRAAGSRPGHVGTRPARRCRGRRCAPRSPANGAAAAPLLARREVAGRGGHRSTGRTTRSCRAGSPARPAGTRRSAGRTASRLPGRSESRSASAKPRIAAPAPPPGRANPGTA